MHGYVSKICVHHKVPKLKSADAAKKKKTTVNVNKKTAKDKGNRFHRGIKTFLVSFTYFYKEKLMI